jgi:hypothetical protein
MTERLKTLVLYANGAKRQAVAIDTALRGLLGFNAERHLPERWLQNRIINRLFGRRYAYASYMDDWMEAFSQSSHLDVVLCNVSNLVEFRYHRRSIEDYPFVIILHSAAGDDLWLLSRTLHWFQRRRGKLLVFVGNEYDLLPAKIAFIRATQADYVGSQLPLDAAQWLYMECQAQVLSTPHALNPKVYCPDAVSGGIADRPIDIGFIGDPYPPFIGDTERTDVVRYFEKQGAVWGLQCDIRTQRLPRRDWSRFLNSCKGIIGAESGTYYLERTDETINAVQAYLRRHPNSSFAELHRKFFSNHPRPMSGKAISSRHFEPIGTQTCQILVEGRYNDILVADKHYIALKKDYSNIAEAVERFKDEVYRLKMANEAYEYVIDAHTYHHRVQAILKQIWGV